MPKREPPFHPVRRLRPAHTEPSRLHFVTRDFTAEIHVLAPDVFRVTFRRRGTPEKPSWAVVPTEFPTTPSRVRHRGSRIAIATDAARLSLDLESGAWTLHDRHGLEVFATPASTTGFAGTAARVSLRLAERESIFGLGETTGTFDKRGLIREFWNIDVLGHAPTFHPGLRSTYVSIPFALSLRDGRAAGLFWDNPARQVWDLGQTTPEEWRMTAASGAIDLYLFAGPGVSEVVGRFTSLTGRTPLPPRWALGYHQSRYSYASRKELEAVAAQLRRRQIPCDALYCDIHHLDGHRVFTFGKDFPQPARMIAGLARRGFKVVTIVDPGVKDDPRFGVLRRGRDVDAFVRNPAGPRDTLGKAWPGPVRFPDFLNARVRDWWGDEQKALHDLGVAGIWNDMNEPANFARPDKTLDPRAIHRTDHGRRRHAEVHNLYGMQMARASRHGALRHRPDERPFVISRAGYAGIQRHALVWTGDNASCWEHLSDAVQMLLNLGLSGVPFVGADVGGFLDHASPELFVRWLQFAVFTPFLRNHSNIDTRRQEPWAFGTTVEGISRRYLDLRYQLLPYLYGLFARAAQDGTPIMRPLFWHHANDPVAVGCNDEFFLGERLLVAPVLRQGAVARSVYLPRGEWFDFWNDTHHRGAAHIVAEAPLDKIPLFVRAGTILPMTESRPFVGAREPETVHLHVWPDDEGRLDWYDDDGRTRAFERGEFQRREIAASSTRRGGWLGIGPCEGPYPGQTRTWRIVLRGARREFAVKIAGRPAKATFVPELSLCVFDVPVTPGATEVRWR